MSLHLKKHNISHVLLFFCGFFLLGCATTKIGINRLAPPKYPIQGGKNLAIVNFQSPQYAPYAGEAFASSFISQLAPSRYYRLMERSRMDSIMAEKRLSQTEYAHPDNIKELGSILNVDYIITGEINAYSVEDEDTFEQEESTRLIGYYYDRRGRRKPRYETYFIDVPVKIRRATVSASFRMVTVDTSKIIAGESKTMSTRKKGCGSEGIASLPSGEELLSMLTENITAYFTNLIAPHPVSDVRTLLKGKTKSCKQGYELAQSGLWEESAAAWNQALLERPEDPAPYNNLGVAAEVRGDYQTASEHYKKALELRPGNKVFMDHLNKSKKLRDLYSRPYED